MGKCDITKHSSVTLENIRFDNSFSRLGEPYGTLQHPTPFASNYLVSLNTGACDLLGLDPQEAARPEFVAYLSGQQTWPGSAPLAMRYAGHQFGHYVPQLGDGRALLLGEIRNPLGEKWDLQLKGGGLTPYSRQGDGRAVLRSTIREYLCSEAMHHLGIPTTRALCIIGSDEEVYREEIETGALLLRVAPSHVRFGSFEVFYYRDQKDAVQILADYVITHYYPELQEHSNKYLSLLRAVVARTAKLMAQWQAVGFAHGVMNTDNMSILGITLDYGPFGFVESYDPAFICNHSDHQGRYAFDQQPGIGLWNLSALAQALIPLISVDAAKQCLDEYENIYYTHFNTSLLRKLGLQEITEHNLTIAQEWLDLLKLDKRDYSISFRALSRFDSSMADNNSNLRDMFISRNSFDRWAQNYAHALRNENSDDRKRGIEMNTVNPKFILRNHLAQIAIDKAKAKDFSEIDFLLKLLQRPFDEQPEHERYATEPPDWAKTISISCSS